MRMSEEGRKCAIRKRCVRGRKCGVQGGGGGRGENEGVINTLNKAIIESLRVRQFKGSSLPFLFPFFFRMDQFVTVLRIIFLFSSLF